MEKLYGTAEVAEMLGKTRSGVYKTAVANSLGRKVGRDIVLTEEEVERLRNWRKPGRPKRTEQAAGEESGVSLPPRDR